MLPNKSIKNISELKNSFTPAWVNPDFIFREFKAVKFLKIGKSFNAFKLKGYSFESMFTILITLVVLGESTISSLTCSVWYKSCKAGKDVFYRLKNNPRICWRQILWSFAIRFTSLVCTILQSRSLCVRAMSLHIARSAICLENPDVVERCACIIMRLKLC